METNKTALILLAAGGSTRMGVPKQLLMYKNRSLLQISIDTGIHSNTQYQLLVLGEKYAQILSQIKLGKMDVIVNAAWEKGMASTLKLGLEYVMEKGSFDQVVVILCDQPFISPELIDQLITTQNATGKGIVACHYKETNGVPVLFTKKYFPELLKLTGKEGAKKLIYEHSGDLALVDFELGIVDIDTREDYRGLIEGL
ncbi:nucleotidyltransferase family protein [Rhodonellum sp.]|uniref:nucleotidyltransferase family protein n=1 Tax=Rhodonellum sp. TaxID=2231180 RepID=UPI002717A254|nr:nucleotidyltransferase family protein [Rhodonellum sp.]MDO9553931.1 nucleotidyltransferase family protein [Rhodonellum sp.]